MIILLDAGHGGMINGQYQTRGKQWTHEDGTTIHEGEFNRAIKARVMERLYQQDIPYVDLCPEHSDIPRSKRVRRANVAHKKYSKNTLLISIHANIGHQLGSGFEVHVSRQASRTSKKFAATFIQSFSKHFPFEKNRGLKRKNWDMVYRTEGPAVLLELFFMDQEREAKKYLVDPEGRDQLADFIVDSILQYLQSSKR